MSHMNEFYFYLYMPNAKLNAFYLKYLLYDNVNEGKVQRT